MSSFVNRGAILGLFLVLAYVAFIAEPTQEPAVVIHDAEAEARRANVVRRSFEERERIIREVRRAEHSSDPADVAGIAAYFAIEDEYRNRARVGVYEADEWIAEQLQGKSLRELGTIDDGRWSPRPRGAPSTGEERPPCSLDP